jgi:site-specific DNA recombinase
MISHHPQRKENAMLKKFRKGRRRKGPEPTTRKAVIYARVSTQQQEREGFSIPAQLKLLREYAEAHNIVVEGEYVDVETAKQAGRSEFGNMVRFLRKNTTVRLVLTEKTDRLYRNIKDWVLIDDLDLEVHLVKEGGALSRDSRSSEKFMHGIRVLMAKNYIDNLSEEVRKGMLEKASQGMWPGIAPFGYRNFTKEDGRKDIAVESKQAPIVVKLFEWFATGRYSIKDLRTEARNAGIIAPRSRSCFTTSHIHKILRNRFYMGELEWSGKIFKGSHEPLVSVDLWNCVQDVLDGRNRTRPDGTGGGVLDFAFTGMIVCGHCGCAITAEIKKGKYIYYHCTGYRGNCREPYIPEKVLEERFADLLSRIRLDQEVHDLILKALRESYEVEKRDHDAAVKRLRGEMDRLQQRLERLYVDKLDETITDDFYRRMTAQWRDEIDRCQRDMNRHVEASSAYMEEGAALITLARKAHSLFTDAPPVEKRRLLSFVLSNCTWKHGELSAEYRHPFDLLAETAAQTATRASGPGAEKAKMLKWMPDEDSNLD